MLSISAQNPQLECALHNTSHVSLDLNIFLTGNIYQISVKNYKLLTLTLIILMLTIAISIK